MVVIGPADDHHEMGWGVGDGSDIAGVQALVAFLLAMGAGFLTLAAVATAGARREWRPLQATGSCALACLGLLISAAYGLVATYADSDFVVLMIGDVACASACMVAYLDAWNGRRGRQLPAFGAVLVAVIILLAATA